MIDSLQNNLTEVLNMTWPMIFISLVLVSSLRVTYLLKNKEEFIFYKELLLWTFMIYILILFQIVTAQDINSMTGNNFLPFKEIFRYKLGGRLFVRNIIGNVLLFIPYGFFSTMYTGNKKLRYATILVFVASLCIEITQLSIGRIFDIDDIILNVLGGLIGYYLYTSIDRIGDINPKIFKSNKFLNILSFIIFSLLIFVILSYIVVWR